MAEPIGVILAAGLGTRLRPITDTLPKPLVPIWGPTSLDWIHARLHPLGCKEIYVNSHHLAEKVSSHLSTYHPRSKVSYEPQILGTGGPLIRPHLDHPRADLLVHNGDIFFSGLLDTLLTNHQKGRYVASMLLLDPPVPGKTPVFAAGGQVRSIGNVGRGGQPHTFTGIHVISPEFFEHMPKEVVPFDIIEAYKKWIDQDRVGCTITRDFWCDFGTPKDLWGLYEHLAPTIGEELRRWFPDSQHTVSGETVVASGHRAPKVTLGWNFVGAPIGAQQSIQHVVWLEQPDVQVPNPCIGCIVTRGGCLPCAE